MKPLVMLIDDSRFARIANERALSRAGYKVIGTDDGERAVEIAKANGPRLILLDLMLPNITGIDVLRQLKAHPETRPIPVIVLSSLSKKNKNALLREGAADMVKKTDDLLHDDSAALVQVLRKFVPAKE